MPLAVLGRNLMDRAEISGKGFPPIEPGIKGMTATKSMTIPPMMTTVHTPRNGVEQTTVTTRTHHLTESVRLQRATNMTSMTEIPLLLERTALGDGTAIASTDILKVVKKMIVGLEVNRIEYSPSEEHFMATPNNVVEMFTNSLADLIITTSNIGTATVLSGNDLPVTVITDPSVRIVVVAGTSHENIGTPIASELNKTDLLTTIEKIENDATDGTTTVRENTTV